MVVMYFLPMNSAHADQEDHTINQRSDWQQQSEPH